MALVAPPSAEAIEVMVLRWPVDAHLRQHLARLRRPRLLLLEAGVPPPALLDDLEDWLRPPFEPEDLDARRGELRRRAAPPPPVPEVDADGLLRLGPAWVALTAAQVPVVQLLVANLDRVVRHEQLAVAYETAGGSPLPASLQTMLKRVGARVEEVGLELITVRRRGVLLTTAARSRR